MIFLQNIFEFDIDIKKKNYINEPILMQNDRVLFKINVYDDDVPFDLKDTIITLANVRPDGKSIIIKGSLSDKNSQALFYISRPENAIVGRVEATAQFYDVDGRVSTAKFSFQVIKDPADFNPTGDEKTLIEVVLGDGPRILDEAEAATEIMLETIENAEEAIIDTTAIKDAADDVRVATEEERLATETVKIATENERLATKYVRESTEQERLNTVTEREATEQVRIDTENVKDATELVRQATEQERLDTAEERVLTESQRLATESVRKETELVKTETIAAKEEAELSTSNANDAAANANQAAQYANAQGHRAEDAADVVEDLLKDGAVASVNGQTGVVVLDADDVGAETPQRVQDRVDAHAEKEIHQEEIHGMRFKDEAFQVFNGTEWIEIKGGSGGGIPLGNVENLNANAEVGLKIALSWNDPDDVILEGITLSKWAGTMLRRKEGTYPVDEKDGILITDSKTRDEYAGDGFIDSGLVDGVTYYYAFFPYDTNDNFTIDSTNRISATAFEKYVQNPPSKPTASNLQQNTVTITSSDGAVVSLDEINWITSPHIFTDLVEGDEYTPYAKFEETDTHWESAVATGDSFIAVNKLPKNPPSGITISNLDHDKATIASDIGAVVSMNQVDWYDSPHVFTGLIEESNYTAYAKFEETDTHVESIVISKEFTTPPEQQIYGVRIDKENSNPETRVTYIGDSVGFQPMRGNNGNFDWGSWEKPFNELEIKPCVLDGGEVQYYLNPNDYTKKVDGTDANITGADGDVMVELGKTIWYKWTDEGATYTIEFSDKAFPGAVKHAFEIEGGYNLANYYPLLLTQIMFTVFFKSTDSQSALGRGRVDGAGYTSTGGTNAKGMFYGSESDEQMKLLGIEDFWGNRYWFIDGIATDVNRNVLIGKSDFNDAGNGYDVHETGNTANVAGYIDTVQGGNDKGFVINSSSGSETTYYTDYGYLDSWRVAHFGGSRSAGSLAGAFCLRLSRSGSGSSASIGARLFCAKDGRIYIGVYLGTTVGGKLRSVSGNQPTGSKTIGAFRNDAKANN